MREPRWKETALEIVDEEKRKELRIPAGWRTKRGWKSAGRAHPVRFSDKISNLKFHRNFTILGSKLIVLSASTAVPSTSYLRHPCHLTQLGLFVSSRPNPPFKPPARKRNFENKQPITHYSPPLSEGVPEDSFPATRKVLLRTVCVCVGDHRETFVRSELSLVLRNIDRKWEIYEPLRSPINFVDWKIGKRYRY